MNTEGIKRGNRVSGVSNGNIHLEGGVDDQPPENLIRKVILIIEDENYNLDRIIMEEVKMITHGKKIYLKAEKSRSWVYKGENGKEFVCDEKVGY